MDEKLLSRYKDSLLHFCLYTSEIQHFAEDLNNHRPVDRKKLIFATSMAEQYKTFLLQDKVNLGYTDGLSFLEDNKFIGFSIISGYFEGDKEKTVPILRKWVDGFPDKANHYQYEVSIYVLTMVYGNLNKELYPEKYFNRLSDESVAA